MTAVPHTNNVVLQVAANWRLDLPSLALGLLAGILMVVAVQWLMPKLLATRDQAAEKLQETRAWVRSGVELRFQAETAEYVQKYHLGERLAMLDQIFVPPRLLAPKCSIDQDNPVRLSPGQLHYLWPGLAAGVAIDPVASVSLAQLLKKARRVVLSSGPGAGKTTLLAYCAYLCATAEEVGPYANLLPFMPVFVHLAELALEAAPEHLKVGEIEPDPLAPLANALQQRTSALTSRGIGELLLEKASAGRVLLLLDGLDELPPQDCQVAIDWLQHLLDAYPEIRVIASGPAKGYGHLLTMGFSLSGLLSWRLGQAEKLGRQWYEILGMVGQLPARIYWQPGQNALETSLRLHLALTGENADSTEAPDRWVDLLELSFRHYLRQSVEEEDPNWLAPAARDLWQQIAYQIVSNAALSIDADTLVELARPVLADFNVKAGGRTTRRLLETVNTCSLFIIRPTGAVSLLNPIWRDYLAAGHLAQSRLRKVAAGHICDPLWSNVLRFYVGRTGGAELAEVHLKDNSDNILHDGLFELASWLPESSDKSEWRRQTLIGLGRLIVDGQKPTALRQRAAAALAMSGEDGVPILLQRLLQQPNAAMRQTALASIAKAAPEVAVDLLVEGKKDSVAQVRGTSAHALAWIQSPAAEKPLLSALLDSDEALSMAAAESLALTGTEYAYEVLREAAGDDALSVRRAALRGLALVDEEWALDIVKQVAVGDHQWLVKSDAEAILTATTEGGDGDHWCAIRLDEQDWLLDWAEARGHNATAAGKAMPLLLKALADADATTRAAAAATLGLLAPDNTNGELKLALGDSAALVRDAAFIALCQINRAWGNESAIRH